MSISGLFISALMIILAYLLGSVPYGLILAKKFCKIDPRKSGSGNPGATNVARLCGKKWGALTLFCDLAKGCLAVLLAILVQGQLDTVWQYTPLAAGFAAVFGHIYPAFLNFKGGKGVATTVGVFLPLAFTPFIISVIICLLVIWRSGFVSAGSISLVLALPIFNLIFGYPSVAVLACIIGAMVLLAHKDNISRLLSGQEKSWTRKEN